MRVTAHHKHGPPFRTGQVIPHCGQYPPPGYQGADVQHIFQEDRRPWVAQRLDVGRSVGLGAQSRFRRRPCRPHATLRRFRVEAQADLPHIGREQDGSGFVQCPRPG